MGLLWRRFGLIYKNGLYPIFDDMDIDHGVNANIGPGSAVKVSTASVSHLSANCSLHEIYANLK